MKKKYNIYVPYIGKNILNKNKTINIIFWSNNYLKDTNKPIDDGNKLLIIIYLITSVHAMWYMHF